MKPTTYSSIYTITILHTNYGEYQHINVSGTFNLFITRIYYREFIITEIYLRTCWRHPMCMYIQTHLLQELIYIHNEGIQYARTYTSFEEVNHE